MTPEQAKQLKKGDKILVAAEVVTVYKSRGEAYIRISCFDGPSDRITFNGAYTLADNIILPTDLQQPAEKPKYDPCRKFKKGDKVKPCSWRNRGPLARWGASRIAIPDTRVYEVTSDERHEHVALIYGDDVIEMHICFLELVTPVEEMEPYYVKDDGTHYVVGKRPEEPEIVYLAEYSKDLHPHAKEAAEAECKRLNEEYRKEQNNGLGH